MNASKTTAVVDVTVTATENGFCTVSPVWSNVDRTTSGGWSAPKALVVRLVAAIKAGKACPNPTILTDINGKTYVSYDTVILGRKMSADLKRLGF